MKTLPRRSVILTALITLFLSQTLSAQVLVRSGDINRTASDLSFYTFEDGRMDVNQLFRDFYRDLGDPISFPLGTNRGGGAGLTLGFYPILRPNVVRPVIASDLQTLSISLDMAIPFNATASSFRLEGKADDGEEWSIAASNDPTIFGAGTVFDLIFSTVTLKFETFDSAYSLREFLRTVNKPGFYNGRCGVSCFLDEPNGAETAFHMKLGDIRITYGSPLPAPPAPGASSISMENPIYRKESKSIQIAYTITDPTYATESLEVQVINAATGQALPSEGFTIFGDTGDFLKLNTPGSATVQFFSEFEFSGNLQIKLTTGDTSITSTPIPLDTSTPDLVIRICHGERLEGYNVFPLYTPLGNIRLFLSKTLSHFPGNEDSIEADTRSLPASLLPAIETVMNNAMPTASIEVSTGPPIEDGETVNVYLLKTPPFNLPEDRFGITEGVSPSGPGYAGIDKHNSSPAGVAVVYSHIPDEDGSDGSLQSDGYLLNAICHEIGHTLGLQHIGPLTNWQDSVMDYNLPPRNAAIETVRDSLKFAAIPFTIRADHPLSFPPTSNPSYVLQRYTAGLSHFNIGVTPGTADCRKSDSFCDSAAHGELPDPNLLQPVSATIIFDNAITGTVLKDVTVVSSSTGCECSTAVLATYPSITLGELSQKAFALNQGSTVGILARTAGSTLHNIQIVPEDRSDNEGYLFEPQQGMSLELRQIDAAGNHEVIGQASQGIELVVNPASVVLERTSSQTSLSFRGDAEMKYSIQRSQDLATWETVATNITGPNIAWAYDETDLKFFYQVITTPR